MTTHLIARPWRGSGAGSNTIYDARDLWIGHVRSAAEVAFILRAVNNYDKMRRRWKIASQNEPTNSETACDVEYADFEQGYDDSIAITRAILKEIDND